MTHRRGTRSPASPTRHGDQAREDRAFVEVASIAWFVSLVLALALWLTRDVDAVQRAAPWLPWISGWVPVGLIVVPLLINAAAAQRASQYGLQDLEDERTRGI